MSEINRSCFPAFKPTNKCVPWWSTELNILRKQVNATKRRFNRCKNSTIKDIHKAKLKSLTNKYKIELLKAKQESWRKFCTENSNASPWKICKACKRGFASRPIHSTLTLQDGSATLTAEDTAAALLDKFFPDDLLTLENEDHSNIRKQVQARTEPTTQPEPEFAFHEVEETIAHLNDRKCPGPDGIDGTIVKRIRKIIPPFWLTLFNKCLSLGCFPKT